MFLTNKKMNRKFEIRTSENAALCSWCKSPLDSANLAQQSVCLRCYEILAGANLLDKEIFDNDKNKEVSCGT